MARPINRVAHNNCVECGVFINEVVYIRPFAKVCPDCKSLAWAGNAQIKKITRELQDRNRKMTPEELGMDEKFEDDPRAVKEIEYGRVIRIPTTLERNDYV